MKLNWPFSIGKHSTPSSLTTTRASSGPAASVAKYLIAGLGNPGGGYEGNRHNVGFWAINRLARRHGIDVKAGRNASVGKGRIGEDEVVLVKPRTFVNRSGDALGPLAKPEGVDGIIVIYDELDLPVARVRLRSKGGSGGHNGLKSIIAGTGGNDFGRIRIGIGRPLAGGEPTWDPDHVMRYVLADPPR